MSPTMKIPILSPSHQRSLLFSFGALVWCYFDDAYTQHAFYQPRFKDFHLKVVSKLWAYSVPTIILVFGNHNQTVIAFQLVIWWAVLFSPNTYQRIGSFFQLANIQWILKTSYYEIQKKKLVGIVKRNHVQNSKEILVTMKRRGNCCLSGDGRCGSPDIMRNT